MTLTIISKLKVLEDQAARLKHETKHTIELMHQHDSEYASTKIENDFLNEHLEVRKEFEGTWYEMNLFDLFAKAKDPIQAELALRRRIHHFDEPFRKTYARVLRLMKERAMSVLGWEKVCRECQVLTQTIDVDVIQGIFHECMLHEPREDGSQPLLHFNEFVEAIVRLAVVRVEGGGLTTDEALDFFMKSHFKFAAGGSAMEGYLDEDGLVGTQTQGSPLKRSASSFAQYNFC